MVDGGPPSGYEMQEGKESDEGAADIDCSLHYIGPDDRGHASLKGVDQCQQGDNADGRDFIGMYGDADYCSDGNHANTFSGGTRQKKDKGCKFMKCSSKSALNKLVCSEKFPLEIVGNEKKADDDSSQQITENNLQESKVRVIGQAGNTDDGERAGFSGDDGKRDRPPGNVPICQEICFERSFLCSKPQAKERNTYQVRNDDDEIECVQAGIRSAFPGQLYRMS